MDADSWLSWVLVGCLILLADYFAVTETAASGTGRVRLRARLEQGDRRAEKALYIQDHFEQAISAILIGTNIVHISLATIVTMIVTNTWGLSYVALGTVVCTMTLFFAGEMLPKSIAKRYSESCALATAGSLCFFMRIFAPGAKLLSKLSEGFSRLFPAPAEPTVTEDELYEVIESLTDEGGLDGERGELVRSALEFGDVTAESVLTARVDLDALDADDSPEEILAVLRSTRHSRLPVYERSVDNIIGILQTRSYLRAHLHGESPDLRSLLEVPCFVHQSAPIDELLAELSRRKQNMAVVTDNYGGTLGIVTVEDILEELVGDIWDEDDVVEESFRALGNDEFEFDAETDMEDVIEKLDIEDDTDWEHKHLGEWVYEQYDMLPRQNDSFTWNRLQVTVQEMQGHRLLKLRIRILPEETEGEGNE